jgi:hypothetical protein
MGECSPESSGQADIPADDCPFPGAVPVQSEYGTVGFHILHGFWIPEIVQWRNWSVCRVLTRVDKVPVSSWLHTDGPWRRRYATSEGRKMGSNESRMQRITSRSPTFFDGVYGQQWVGLP